MNLYSNIILINFFRTVLFLRSLNAKIYFGIRALTRALIWGGECDIQIFIYSCYAQQISFQIEKFEFDLKRNSPGRTAIYEYSPPPPPINVLVTALFGLTKLSGWRRHCWQVCSQTLDKLCLNCLFQVAGTSC